MIKIAPKKNKCKKAKWLSEDALQIVEKRREAKGKGEKNNRLVPNRKRSTSRLYIVTLLI